MRRDPRSRSAWTGGQDTSAKEQNTQQSPGFHHKAEYFSAVLKGVLVLVAALSILREAYLGFLDPRPVEAPLLGMAINGVATVMNAAWSSVLLRFGRRWRSLALVADGKHLLTDVATSCGVLLGFALVPLTGWLWLDPALAAVVAVNILWTGWGLVRESVGGLMDAAPAREVLNRIRAVISASAEGAIEAHDLRVRHAGRVTFVEFHLVVPREMPVGDAHEICDWVEQALCEETGRPDHHSPRAAAQGQAVGRPRPALIVVRPHACPRSPPAGRRDRPGWRPHSARGPAAPSPRRGPRPRRARLMPCPRGAGGRPRDRSLPRERCRPDRLPGGPRAKRRSPRSCAP